MTSTADEDEGRTFAAALFGRSDRDNADDDHAPNEDTGDGGDTGGAREYARRLFSHSHTN